MMISISGMVGSGKSTAAALIVDRLAKAGLQPQYLRFRYLKLFAFPRPGRKGPPREDGAQGQRTEVRASSFALRRLTAARALGYAARIIAFRFSGVGAGSRCDVLDRYFYDNFVQYKLTGPMERLYARVLRGLIPTPDLAIVLLASPETLAARRQNYAREYLVLASGRYAKLAGRFPNIVTVSTDPGRSGNDHIERLIQTCISRARPRPHDKRSK